MILSSLVVYTKATKLLRHSQMNGCFGGEANVDELSLTAFLLPMCFP